MGYTYSKDLLINSDQKFAIENINAPSVVKNTNIFHIHKFYEILYVYSGEKILKTKDDTEFILDANHIAFISPYKFHTTYTSENKNYKRVLINFTPDFLKTHDEETDQKLFSCFNNATCVIPLKKEKPMITELFQKILYEYNAKNDIFSEQAIKLLLSQLLISASRLLFETSNNSTLQNITSSYYLKIHEISEYIKLNYFDEISLSAMEHKFNISQFAISREFPNVTGFSFTTYVNNIRMQQVAEMLLSSKEKISTIAHNCGYESIKNFNRIFKKTFGLSPSEYRSLSHIK